MIEFRYEGHLIHYSVSGQGKPLVLLHGFLEDSSIWDSVSKTFFKSYSIIKIDLPCHGLSRFTGDHCSMDLMALIVDSLFQFLHIENPIIIGHSMGGYVGLEILKLRPANLILLHSNFWEDPLEKKNDRNRVVALVKEKKEHFITEAIPGLFAEENKQKCSDAIASLIQKAKNIPAHEIAAVTAGMRDRNDNSVLVENEGIAIIHGELDPIISDQKLSAELSHLLNPPQPIVIPHCGHMSLWEAPEALTRAIKKAIKSRN